MPRTKTANAIINQIAGELGVSPATDVFASTDEIFTRLAALANACGRELVEAGDITWQAHTREHTFTTDGVASSFDLPSDFAYLIPSTTWNRSDDLPMTGGQGNQLWAYHLGRDLSSSTLYLQFRLDQNKFEIFPQPPANGQTIAFSYASTDWVLDGGVADTYTDTLEEAADVPLFSAYLFERLVKLRFLESMGLDTAAAAQQFNAAYDAIASRDQPSQPLNAGGCAPGTHLLGGGNVGDTGFGQ